MFWVLSESKLARSAAEQLQKHKARERRKIISQISLAWSMYSRSMYFKVVNVTIQKWIGEYREIAQPMKTHLSRKRSPKLFLEEDWSTGCSGCCGEKNDMKRTKQWDRLSKEDVQSVPKSFQTQMDKALSMLFCPIVHSSLGQSLGYRPS